MTTAVLILAAGASRRMGRPKQLLPWGDTTVLGRVVATALHLGPTFVVLGAHRAAVAASLEGTAAIPVTNPDHASGMAGSIRTGLAAVVRARPDCEYLLVLLADQPGVTADYLTELLTLAERDGPAPAATRYAAGPGVPAVFTRSAFPHLRELKTEGGGARRLLATFPDLRTLVPPTEPFDLDTPADYARHHAGDL